MNRAVVGAGSNIRPQFHIALGEELLGREQGLIQKSNFSWTKPIGPIRQPEYWNGAYLIETKLDLEGFNKYLKDLERRIGRAGAADKWGPREIDLDIIVWNGQIISEDYDARDFVRNAVCEIMPELSKEMKQDEK